MGVEAQGRRSDLAILGCLLSLQALKIRFVPDDYFTPGGELGRICGKPCWCSDDWASAAINGKDAKQLANGLNSNWTRVIFTLDVDSFLKPHFVNSCRDQINTAIAAPGRSLHAPPSNLKNLRASFLKLEASSSSLFGWDRNWRRLQVE